MKVFKKTTITLLFIMSSILLLTSCESDDLSGDIPSVNEEFIGAENMNLISKEDTTSQYLFHNRLVILSYKKINRQQIISRSINSLKKYQTEHKIYSSKPIYLKRNLKKTRIQRKDKRYFVSLDFYPNPLPNEIADSNPLSKVDISKSPEKEMLWTNSTSIIDSGNILE